MPAVYRVGSPNDGWSSLLQFKTLPLRQDWTSPKILIFGDLGNGNDRTLAMLQEEVQLEKVDFAIHLGDFAYNLEVGRDHITEGTAFFSLHIYA